MNRVRIATFYAIVILTFLTAIPAHAQVEFSTAIGIGALLSKLGDEVKEAEEKAIAGGMVLEIGAGGVLSQAIRQAQDAYANSLQLTIDKLSGEQQTTLASLTSAANDFVTKGSASASALEDKAKAIIHQLPFSKNYPQVVSYLPKYVSKQDFNDDGTIRVRLDGDFVDVTRPRYMPELKVGSATYEPTAKTNDFIEFHLNPKDLVFADKSITTNQLHLDIPWRQAKLFGMFDKEEHTEFVLPVVTLPPLAGKITITTTVSSPGVVRQNVESPEIPQESGDDDIKDGGEHGDRAIHTWPPDPGFQVEPGTVHYQITWSQGKEGVDQDWWFSRNLSTPNQAVLAFSTEHHRFGSSGKIHFKIQFTEEKPVTISTTATMGPTEVPFGSSKVFEVPPGANWKGTLELFNGNSFDFAGPLKNAYVTVQVAGNMITVSTIP